MRSKIIGIGFLIYTLSCTLSTVLYGQDPVDSATSTDTNTAFLQFPSLSSILRFDRLRSETTPIGHSRRPKHNYYLGRDPFFCRLEDSFAQKNPIQFKMRLGSVNYVDHLERKPNSSRIGMWKHTP